MTNRTPTRRRMISLVGAGTVVGLAGCGDLGEEGSGETDEGETATDEDDETDDDGTDENDGMNGDDALDEEGDDVSDDEVDENEGGDGDDDAEIQEVDGYGRGADGESDEDDT